MNARTIVIATLFAFALGPAVALADDAGSSTATLEELAIEMATTPEQHAALAGYYREKASEARGEAARHRQMHHGYGVGKAGAAAFANHCKRLVELYESQASEYDALATLHDEQAAEAHDAH